MKYFIAILLPPLAILLCGKIGQAILNFILTLLFWVPGVIHAILVVGQTEAERRHLETIAAMGGTPGDKGSYILPWWGRFIVLISALGGGTLLLWFAARNMVELPEANEESGILQTEPPVHEKREEESDFSKVESKTPITAKAADEPKIASPQVIAGVSVENLVSAYQLEARGFVLHDQGGQPPERYWMYRLNRKAVGDSFLASFLTFTGDNPKAIRQIEAQYFGTDESARRNFYTTIASLGSQSPKAEEARNWVQENISGKASAKIGDLEFALEEQEEGAGIRLLISGK